MVYVETKNKNIYLGSIAFRLGEIKRTLSQDIEEGIDTDWSTLLFNNGMNTYFKTDRNCFELANDSVRETIGKSGLDPCDIDAVVFTSYSYRSSINAENLVKNNQNYCRHVKSIVTHGLDFENVEMFGTFLTESGNFVSVVRMARNLIRAEKMENILCILADRIPESPPQIRGAKSGVMINSDVGLSFIVSRKPGEYQIENLNQVFSPYLNTMGSGMQFQKKVEIMRGITTSGKKTLEEIGRSPEEYSKLIINNYSLDLMYQFAGYLNFPKELLFVDNLKKFAHAFTADNLINLSDISESIKNGSLVFMLAVGTTNWGTISLRKVA